MAGDIDSTAPKHLRGKYAIVGVGETGYTRGSGCTTRTLGTRAVRAAIEDAGLEPGDVDGMLSYSNNDSTPSPMIAGDLGVRLNFHMDVYGGGSSTEALVGIAIGVIEAGMLPKVEGCLDTLDRGVRKVHIIDGRLRHSLLLEIYTNRGVGTQLIAEPE